MAKKIVYYETTKSYGKIMKGIKFKVVKDLSKHINACIREGLSEETGVPEREINLGMLQCKEV